MLNRLLVQQVKVQEKGQKYRKEGRKSSLGVQELSYTTNEDQKEKNLGVLLDHKKEESCVDELNFLFALSSTTRYCDNNSGKHKPLSCNNDVCQSKRRSPRSKHAEV
jgi:hypothetical protein